jgi:hypothetical protein
LNLEGSRKIIQIFAVFGLIEVCQSKLATLFSFNFLLMRY